LDQGCWWISGGVRPVARRLALSRSWSKKLRLINTQWRETTAAENSHGCHLGRTAALLLLMGVGLDHGGNSARSERNFRSVITESRPRCPGDTEGSGAERMCADGRQQNPKAGKFKETAPRSAQLYLLCWTEIDTLLCRSIGPDCEHTRAVSFDRQSARTEIRPIPRRIALDSRLGWADQPFGNDKLRRR
jgi:hypothetical protein